MLGRGKNPFHGIKASWIRFQTKNKLHLAEKNIIGFIASKRKTITEENFKDNFSNYSLHRYSISISQKYRCFVSSILSEFPS